MKLVSASMLILSALFLVGCSATPVAVEPDVPALSSSSYVAPVVQPPLSSSSTATYVPEVSSSSYVAVDPVVTPTPVYASVYYTAGSNTTYGEFFISYTVTNNSTVPIKVTSILYNIYGSNGGVLNDIVLTDNSYDAAWIPVGGSIDGWLEGYSRSYIPYGFDFTVSAIGLDGGSNWDIYSGNFKVYLTKKGPSGGPMTHPNTK